MPAVGGDFPPAAFFVPSKGRPSIAIGAVIRYPQLKRKCYFSEMLNSFIEEPKMAYQLPKLPYGYDALGGR